MTMTMKTEDAIHEAESASDQNPDTADTLRSMCACEEAILWVESASDQGPDALWDACPRGDWLLWYAWHADVDGYADVDQRTLVIAAYVCVRLALRYVPGGEDDLLRAIETAEAWARGEATIEPVITAARAAAGDAAEEMDRLCADAVREIIPEVPT